VDGSPDSASSPTNGEGDQRDPPPPWYIGPKRTRPRLERLPPEEKVDLLRRLSIYEGPRLPPGWDER
jgi:hypothetical protein